MVTLNILYIVLFVGLSFIPIFVLRKKSQECRLLKEENELKSNELKEAKSELFVLNDRIKDLDKLNEELALKKQNLKVIQSEISEFNNQLEPFSEHITLSESGFYRYIFDFEDIDKYNEALMVVKESQKVMIKNNEAVLSAIPELVSSDITKNLAKVALSALNAEAELIMKKVTYMNFDSCKDKITKKYDSLNKNLSTVKMNISPRYLSLKLKELAIGFEFEEEKQKVKEEQAEIMAQMREEEAARREAEKAREDAIKEESKYEEALNQARIEMEGKSEEEKDGMLAKIAELELKLKEAHEERQRATSMAQITKAGHVYIISNIGSFGENVYKIGMTRRKEPLDRVKELGDASVPFQFDVHAMVYAENAPELENSLHKYFESRRVNKVNLRKEFFEVSLDEIEKACTELGKKIKVTKAADAHEYRETLLITEESKVA